jgi:hypothetical protein
VSGGDAWRDRQALLELDALLGELIALRDKGEGDRFNHDQRYRWILHRLWGRDRERGACSSRRGRPVRTTQPWAKLYGLRNHLSVIDFPTSMTDESDASRG